MYRIIISIWLVAAGSGAVLAEQPAVEPASAGSQLLSSPPDAKFTGGAMPAPVTSVTRLRKLPDGSVVQQCDIVEVKAVRDPEGGRRGEWIQVPDARVR